MPTHGGALRADREIKNSGQETPAGRLETERIGRDGQI